MPASPTFLPERLIAAVHAALMQHGLSQEIAEVEARLAVEADRHGVPSHGVLRVPLLLKGLRDGRVNAAPVVKLLKNTAAVCVLDGDGGPGRYTSTRAMAEAIARARKYGIGACLATRTGHWGRGHAYAVQAAQQGLIGLAMTNAVTSMAAWGLPGRTVGNNPLAIAVPGLHPEEPIVLDMAMSQAAVGKVATFLREGKSLPAGWGVDSQGQPTENAAAILGGAVLPMGDHKGAGLALMVQLMTAALAGGLLDHELRQHDASGLDTESSKLFLSLDVAAFADPAVLRERTASLIAWLDGQADSASADFSFPGQRGWMERRRSETEGVTVHAEIVAALVAAGVQL